MQGPSQYHGTLVTGVICARGVASDGRIRGVAHGATVFSEGGLGTPGYDFSSWWTEANLRVFSHSITSNPIETAEGLYGLAPGADVLFTQSVGNAGGDGTEARTEPFLHSDPRLRGDRDDPATWPDLTAPGCMFSTSARADGSLVRSLSLGSGPSGHERRVPADDPRRGAPELPGRVRARGRHELRVAVRRRRGASDVRGEPGPRVTDAAWLLTRTADPFLPTVDGDGDGEISVEEFWAQHGWEAGYGYVNAARAVAAAHYLALTPGASPADAVACGELARVSGRPVLNPDPAGCAAAA